MTETTTDELQRLVRLMRNAQRSVNPSMMRAGELAVQRLAEALAREYGLPDTAALIDLFDGDIHAPKLVAEMFAYLGDRRR